MGKKLDLHVTKEQYEIDILGFATAEQFRVMDEKLGNLASADEVAEDMRILTES